MTDPRKFKAPYNPEESIWQEADRLRAAHPAGCSARRCATILRATSASWAGWRGQKNHLWKASVLGDESRMKRAAMNDSDLGLFPGYWVSTREQA